MLPPANVVSITNELISNVTLFPELSVELLDESSFFAQEMMVRLKREMRIM
jgi:hypothetical protein